MEAVTLSMSTMKLEPTETDIGQKFSVVLEAWLREMTPQSCTNAGWLGQVEELTLNTAELARQGLSMHQIPNIILQGLDRIAKACLSYADICRALYDNGTVSA